MLIDTRTTTRTSITPITFNFSKYSSWSKHSKTWIDIDPE